MYKIESKIVNEQDRIIRAQEDIIQEKKIRFNG